MTGLHTVLIKSGNQIFLSDAIGKSVSMNTESDKMPSMTAGKSGAAANHATAASILMMVRYLRVSMIHRN
jgi:hypothetical protein